MGQYSNDPMYGGPAPAGPPASQWGGQGPMAGPPGYPPPGMGMAPVMADQGPKWPALRTIAMVLKIVAWIVAVVGGIGVLIIGFTLGSVQGAGGLGFLYALFGLVGVAIDFLVIYATSELILVFITIEKNTRKN